MTSISVQTNSIDMENIAVNCYMLESLQVLTSFHGTELKNWLAGFERVAALNEWDNTAKLRRVYFYLGRSANMLP